MPMLYLTPASISYMAQFILSFCMTLYLVMRVFRREQRDSQVLFFTGFLFCITVFSGLLFLDASLLPGPRLLSVYLVNPVLAVGLVFLIQFVYRFPALPERLKWEARVLLALSLSYTAYEIFFAIYRYALLFQFDGVDYRPAGGDYVLVALFVWIPLTFLRQGLLADERPLALMQKLWQPQGSAALSARNFALIFLVPLILGIANILRAYSSMSATVFNLLMSLGILLGLWLLTIVYINYLPVVTPFLAKLSGITLALALAFLGSVSWVLTPTYNATFRPLLTENQSLRFTPNAGGGYDLAQIPFNFEVDLGQKLAVTASGSGRNQVLDFRFPFFGKNYSQVYVTSLGLVKMGTELYHPNLQYKVGQIPGIFPLLIDLQPASSGGVFARLAPDRLVVTWNQLPALLQPDSIYTFQAVLYSDGRFDFNYKDLPDPLTFGSDSTPSASIWVRGATPGLSSPVALADDLSRAVRVGPQGLLQDYNASFRTYQSRFDQRLGWLTLAATVLLLVVVPFLFNLNILMPLNALLVSIQQVDGGRLDVSTPVQSLDEIGLLTQSFNKMVAWLKALVDGLEQRVAVRTAELELSNRNLQEVESIRLEAQDQLVEQQRILATLAERERVSRDLHDGLAQVIHAISLQTQAAQALLARGEQASANASLDSVIKMAHDANSDIRKTILGLRIQAQPETGFISDLDNYLQVYSTRTGIKTHLSIPADRLMFMLVPVVEDHILRIIQEALANIDKHAQAHNAEVMFSADERSIQLTISDDGAGFDTRLRLDDSNQHFGLDMMRERVKILGGRLELRSAPGQGTKIMIFFPRLLAAPPLGNTQGLLSLRVLLADDSPLHLDGLQKLLSARGLTVVGMAHDGLEAQEIVRRLHPDIVLMDVIMPRCDGIKATLAITTEFPDIKVVMLTSSEKEEHLIQAIKSGASGYMLKGVDIGDIMDALEKLMRGELIFSPELTAHMVNEISTHESVIDENFDDFISPAARGDLSDPQLKMIRLAADGMTYREIGEYLHLSEATIKVHMKHIRGRLHLKTHAELVQRGKEFVLKKKTEGQQ